MKVYQVSENVTVNILYKEFKGIEEKLKKLESNIPIQIRGAHVTAKYESGVVIIDNRKFLQDFEDMFGLFKSMYQIADIEGWHKSMTGRQVVMKHSQELINKIITDYKIDFNKDG